ncbi:GNAT family N-acetyltransferase [Paracoccus nototheniae]|uniref:GNAT family N-acetyltransferase n=1 Tax=Paracoccus nototheniae TaxID=2489002 RepID=UPI0013F49521|nr:GNAT family N-acetyltransferase [Paracoccus nototheniae]
MTFRLARPADAPVLAAISIEVWLGTYLRQGVDPFFAEFALTEFTPDKLSALIEDPRQHIIVSENQAGLDGFIRISHGTVAPVADCSSTEISTLYVQPRHHGRGLGRALLARGLDHARASGAPSVWLTTNAENAPAIAFYLRQGFRNVGTTLFRIRDQAYPNDVFRRTLTPGPDEGPSSPV